MIVSLWRAKNSACFNFQYPIYLRLLDFVADLPKFKVKKIKLTRWQVKHVAGLKKQKKHTHLWTIEPLKLICCLNILSTLILLVLICFCFQSRQRQTHRERGANIVQFCILTFLSSLFLIIFTHSCGFVPSFPPLFFIHTHTHVGEGHHSLLYVFYPSLLIYLFFHGLSVCTPQAYFNMTSYILFFVCLYHIITIYNTENKNALKMIRGWWLLAKFLECFAHTIDQINCNAHLLMIA